MSAEPGGTPIVIWIQLQDDAALLEGFIEFSRPGARYAGQTAVREQRQRVELHAALGFRQCLVHPPQLSQYCEYALWAPIWPGFNSIAR